MQKSGIEYLTHSWSFYTGCLNQENGVCALPCWAKAMAHRFGRSFEPELHVEKIGEPLRGARVKGRRIGVCFTGDLFGDWVNPEQEGLPGLELRGDVFNLIRLCPDDQFFFLTKCPWNLKKWGEFPDNAWVGVSAWDFLSFSKALYRDGGLMEVTAKHKWLSLEPLLGQMSNIVAGDFENCGINWVVIGGQTAPTKLPEKAWVDEIVAAANRAGIPVWIKNNLKPLLGENLRQELP